ncbi:MAG: CvpA family protein [Planctomycetales bacterium]|nr:CvpA family protein [Planctomycetales bacterium]
MQAYDLVMLIVIGMSTIFGAIKGFAWQVASIASVVLSYVVAYRFRFDVAQMIKATPPWNQFLAMLILFMGTSFVIWVLFRLFSGLIDRVKLKEFDRHLGAAFGLSKGLIYCLLITMFAMSLLGPNQQAAICNSRSGYYIASALDHGLGVLPREIHDVVGPYLTDLDNKLKNGQNGNLAENNTTGSNWNTQATSTQDLGSPSINVPALTQAAGQLIDSVLPNNSVGGPQQLNFPPLPSSSNWNLDSSWGTGTSNIIPQPNLQPSNLQLPATDFGRTSSANNLLPPLNNANSTNSSLLPSGNDTGYSAGANSGWIPTPILPR